MKRLAAPGLTALGLTALSMLAMTLQAHASEGRVSDARSAAPDAARVSRYQSGAPENGMPKSNAVQQKAGAGEQITYRGTVQKSGRASDFYIYDAGHTLRRDRDGDSHHSEFRIRFDADVVFGDALVYAKLYIRRIGESGDWRLYHVTDDFWIYGQSGTDDYFVDTTLDEGFATANYDVLIDLYEVGYSGIVATLDAGDDSSLGYLPLEEVGLDVPFGLPGFRINEVVSGVSFDADRDGFYTRLRVDFDPDADFGGNWAYAVIWVRANGGEWIREHESADFLVDASGTADAYGFTADWISGYPTGYYDVQIDLHDAATGLLVASAGSERPALAELPMEDESRDRAPGSPAPGGGVTVVSNHEHGGGSMSIFGALALLGLLGVRVVKQRTH
jgi:hypothetical protein